MNTIANAFLPENLPDQLKLFLALQKENNALLAELKTALVGNVAREEPQPVVVQIGQYNNLLARNNAMYITSQKVRMTGLLVSTSALTPVSFVVGDSTHAVFSFIVSATTPQFMRFDASQQIIIARGLELKAINTDPAGGYPLAYAWLLPE